jgi:hypothetical protein
MERIGRRPREGHKAYSTTAIAVNNRSGLFDSDFETSMRFPSHPFHPSDPRSNVNRDLSRAAMISARRNYAIN